MEVDRSSAEFRNWRKMKHSLASEFTARGHVRHHRSRRIGDPIRSPIHIHASAMLLDGKRVYYVSSKKQHRVGSLTCSCWVLLDIPPVSWEFFLFKAQTWKLSWFDFCLSRLNRCGVSFHFLRVRLNHRDVERIYYPNHKRRMAVTQSVLKNPLYVDAIDLVYLFLPTRHGSPFLRHPERFDENTTPFKGYLIIFDRSRAPGACTKRSPSHKCLWSSILWSGTELSWTIALRQLLLILGSQVKFITLQSVILPFRKTNFHYLQSCKTSWARTWYLHFYWSSAEFRWLHINRKSTGTQEHTSLHWDRYGRKSACGSKLHWHSHWPWFTSVWWDFDEWNNVSVAPEV